MGMVGRLARLKLRKTPADIERALRFVISDAGANVPYYRTAFEEAGVVAAHVKCVEDLPRLPMTDRDRLLASGHEGHLRRGVDRQSLFKRHTSGTSGTPITVYMNRAESLFRKASLIDSFRRNARLGFPMTIVDVGAEREMHTKDFVQRLGLVNVVRIGRSLPMGEQAECLRQVNPTVIEGRPSMLCVLAQELSRQGIDSVRPRLVVSFAEVLYPHVRKLLQDTFSCRVADYDNCEEVGNVAWQCPEIPDRMHVNPATVLLEVVDEQGEPAPCGREGRVLVTNLYNTTMPFIRYGIGDRGALLESTRCSCGFVGQTMHLIGGRDEDFFVLPDDREVSPRVIYAAVEHALPLATLGNEFYRAVRAFQIVQQERDLIVVRAVPGPAYSRGLWKNLDSSFKALHPSMRVQVVEVEDLHPGPGGKFKQVLRRVARARGTS